MIQINNAEKFKKLFGMYATELWSAQEKDFLQWLNTEYVPDTNVGELISRQAAIDAVETKIKKWNAVDGEGYHVGLGLRYTDVIDTLTELPSVQPRKGKWNNHTVACLLADMFGDTCACNFNGIDEWLPQKCELVDSCPNTVGVACWEQFLTHREDMRGGDAK